MSTLIAPFPELDEDELALPEYDDEEGVSPITSERREQERSHALRLLYASEIGQQQPIDLPILATAGDVREVVQYLKKKPGGVSVVEAMDDVKRRVFEPRKIAAYEFWGIVQRQSGDRLQLSQLGWEFARKLEPETEAYRKVLDTSAPYRAALEWMHRENQELVTHTEVAAYWRKLYAAAIEQNSKTVESSVVCFFHLCQAAEIGTMTIGKRGQPARLRIEREELVGFIEGRRTTLQTAAPNAAPEFVAEEFAHVSFAPRPFVKTTIHTSEKIRLLISCRTETKLVDKLPAALGLLDIECRTIISNESDALPVNEDMFQAMRECDAALIVVTADDCSGDETGGHTLNQSLLSEINTAFVLYDRRVALLCDGKISLPGQLSSLPRFNFEGDELTWDVGVSLLRLGKEFRSLARQTRTETG